MTGRRILCLHTAEVHVQSFNALFEALAPGLAVSHMVRPDWLEAAQADGLSASLVADVGSFLRAASVGNDAVLCSCSTLGPIVDGERASCGNLVRIDTPLMQRAAATAGTALVAYCLDSTRASTVSLLEAAYRRHQRAYEYKAIHCQEAWAFFERGDRAGFTRSIAETVLAAGAEEAQLGCVVLAQASMAVAEPSLVGLGVPIYASPRLAVEEVLRVMAWTAEKSQNKGSS